mgnify:CR=1 FL=1
MKKQLICTLLCVSMLLASSLPAFAAKTTTEPLEEPEVKPLVQAEIFETPYVLWTRKETRFRDLFFQSQPLPILPISTA